MMRAVKTTLLSLSAVGLLAATVFGIRAVSGRKSPSPGAGPAPVESAALASRATLADLRVREARQFIAERPEKADGYNLLASAYMQKARETGDFGFNSRAEAALTRSLESEPDNYDAVKLRAKLLLTYHRFAEALEVAERALSIRPDDHDVYGAMTDALVELGDYERAVSAAQKMVDLRPDTSSYARVSYLRTLHGDPEGAIEAMLVAAKAADPRDPEGVAWCRVQLGDELMNMNRRTEAERQYDSALYAFPDYHMALAGKARARVAAGDMEQAVSLYRRALERVPSPDTAIALGDLLGKLGRTDEARQQYQLVELTEREGALGSTYSRQLALFWADHDMNLDEALSIAERERAARRDIYTCDALAWCLFKKGRLAAAASAIDEALRLGTRDARINYHAGMIAQALGDRRRAARHLKLALEINPSFDVLQAEVARHALNMKSAVTSTGSARAE